MIHFFPILDSYQINSFNKCKIYKAACLDTSGFSRKYSPSVLTLHNSTSCEHLHYQQRKRDQDVCPWYWTMYILFYLLVTDIIWYSCNQNLRKKSLTNQCTYFYFFVLLFVAFNRCTQDQEMSNHVFNIVYT